MFLEVVVDAGVMDFSMIYPLCSLVYLFFFYWEKNVWESAGACCYVNIIQRYTYSITPFYDIRRRCLFNEANICSASAYKYLLYIGHHVRKS